MRDFTNCPCTQRKPNSLKLLDRFESAILQSVSTVLEQRQDPPHGMYHHMWVRHSLFKFQDQFRCRERSHLHPNLRHHNIKIKPWRIRLYKSSNMGFFLTINLVRCSHCNSYEDSSRTPQYGLLTARNNSSKNPHHVHLRSRNSSLQLLRIPSINRWYNLKSTTFSSHKSVILLQPSLRTVYVVVKRGRRNVCLPACSK